MICSIYEAPSSVVFWVACLTMFFGLFRKSNVLAPATRFDPAKHLVRSDIIGHPWALKVQSRCHTLRGTLCALQLLWSMLSVWHLQPHYLGQLSCSPLCLRCNPWGTHNLSKSWKTLVCRLKCLRATVSTEEVHLSQCRQAYRVRS